MRMDVQELETMDYDIIENAKMALYRLWKQKWIVVMVTLFGVFASFAFIGVVGVQTNYLAKATIYSAVYGSYEDSTYGVKVMNTYASLLKSQSVCERAAASLQDQGINATTLKNMASNGYIYLSGASRNSNSYGYQLTLVAYSGTSENVVAIANAMAQAYTDEINDLMGNNMLQVMDKALGYSSSKSLNVPLIIILFAAIAFIGTAGIIFVKEFFSPYVYSVAQCEQNKEMILGLVPYEK